MNEQQDEFFVQPEIEEVHDIKDLDEATPILDKPITEQPKNIPLKMVEIPKDPQSLIYRPFKFERVQSEEQQEEDVHYDYDSPFTEYYEEDQMVYKRLHNQQFRQINNTIYFAGAFLHRNIFIDGTHSYSYELTQSAKAYYDMPSTPLPSPKHHELEFDSHFQSGNLFAAFKTAASQYDLVMQNDVNSVGNNQWFYFSVKKMIPNRQYTFSVINFTKNDSLFNYGMAPAVYSVAENNGQIGIEKGWKRQGKDVSYRKGALNRQNSRRMYYKLVFKISTPYQNDTLFIAHSYPYTIQKLNKFLTDKASKQKDLVTRIPIGKTLSKRLIEGLVICQPINKKRDNRKAVIIMARQHPGQTQGSYVCQGVVEKLLSKSKQTQFLIKNFVVYVIPMVNPDGVVYGHYRTNLAGKDLNRKWNITQKDQSCPEVTSIKAFIHELSKEREIRFILDLHGHSKKYHFFYGNPCPQNPDVVRIFPYVCSKLHPAVQYMDCTFAAQEYKRKAARVYLSFLHRLIHVYTFESSFYAYFKQGERIPFTPKQYRELGGVLMQALFMQLEHEVKFQQSFQFNLKKNNGKQYTNSQFVKMLGQLKNNKSLIQQGNSNQSGSESHPEATQINNEDMEKIKPVRPSSTPSVQGTPNPRNKSRRGIREARDYTFNKPIRNIKFLEISRVNSILPDKYQLGLQPIRSRKEAQPQTVMKPSTAGCKVTSQVQTEPKNQLKSVQFKPSEIEQCMLSASVKLESSPQRKFSSVIRTNNRNIIFKFDIFGNTTARQEDMKPQRVPLVFKHTYSQTMITYSKEGGQKIRSSQVLPQVETPEQSKQARLRNNSIRADSSLRGGVRREAEVFFNGMIKRLINEKQVSRGEQMATKFVLQKPLSIKKKEISRK